MDSPSAALRAPATRECYSLRERGSKPLLSVIIVSQGSRHELDRAVRTVAQSVQALKAQLIVVRRNAEAIPDYSLSEAGRVDVIRAPEDCTRNDMLAMAMGAALGDIIAVREDRNVHDHAWLDGCGRAIAGVMSGLALDRVATRDSRPSEQASDVLRDVVRDVENGVPALASVSKAGLHDAPLELLSGHRYLELPSVAQAPSL